MSLLRIIVTIFSSSVIQLIIPEEAPLADDVDYEELAKFEMSGGNMKGAVFRAAARAALRDEGRDRML